MILSDLWEKINYVIDANIILSKPIIEIDIEKANISVLRSLGLISSSIYDKLYHMPKSDRVIAIGKMQRDDPKITLALQEGIKDIRKIIFNIYNIKSENVISIRNDAVYFINDASIPMDYNSEQEVYQHGIDSHIYRGIVFKKTAQYRSFYKLRNLQLLYMPEYSDIKEELNVAGISDERLEFHKLYFMEFLKVLFESAEKYGIKDSINLLKSFYIYKYTTRSLPIGYYRRFDAKSKFDIIDISDFSEFQADFLDENSSTEYINIVYNESILRDLNRLYSSILFSSH